MLSYERRRQYIKLFGTIAAVSISLAMILYIFIQGVGTPVSIMGRTKQTGWMPFADEMMKFADEMVKLGDSISNMSDENGLIKEAYEDYDNLSNLLMNKERYTIDEEKKVVTKALSHVVVNGISEEINIILTKEPEIRVHLHGEITGKNVKKLPTLTLSQKNGKAIFEVSNMNNGIANMQYRLKLDVYMPEQYQEDLTVDTAAGDIYYDHLSLKNIRFKTISGNQIGNFMEGNTITIETTSGNIKSEIVGKETLSVSSISGDSEFTSINTDILTMNTTSGIYTINNVVATELLFKSISGDLEVTNADSQITDIDTTSGRIKLFGLSGLTDISSISGNINLALNEIEHNLTIKTSSGSIAMDLPEDAAINFAIKTSSGRIKMDNFQALQYIKNEARVVEGVIGDADRLLEITTISGDVYLNVN